MEQKPDLNHNTRIGFHYFPDTLHYRETDLQVWLPELRDLGASWLTMWSSYERAIPESFIHALTAAGIQPIIQFSLPLVNPPAPHDLKPLLDSYARWGVQYIDLFDRPNSRSAWSSGTWAQQDLVERFLDRFVPLADVVQKSGLAPVFPALEPGGSYWDTAFLHTALESLARRNLDGLLSQMALSAYAWTGERSLNWGAGGPERWPGARPYFTPTNEEDHRGFRIFDWYQSIARSALGHTCPMILFGVGSALDQAISQPPSLNPLIHTQTNLTIGQLLAGEEADDPANPEKCLEPVPPEVIAANFWLLAAAPGSPSLSQAWFQPEGNTLTVVGAFKQWIANREKKQAKTIKLNDLKVHPIAHYVLLPVYEWGVADWHLDIIRPFMKKHQPTVGYSLEEAAYAAHVTVIGNHHSFPEESLEALRQAGCQVERISGDGTSIATQLAER